MHIGHQEAVIANGGLTACTCTPVECGKLPDGGIVSYLKSSLLAAELKVLGYCRN